MEAILENLSMDATAGKLKAITDACDEGLEALSRERSGKIVEPYELREKCLLPLKLALESRVSKLSSHALRGFHKLISDERFQSLVEGDVHRQLPVQFVNAVVSTPSMSDEIQVEIMKMLLMITCSASCEVHGEYLIKIAEVCIETYTRSSQTWTKTACRATLTQMISSVCNDLEESLKKEMLSHHSKDSPHSIRGLDLISNESSKILTQDVLMLMKHFCSQLSPSHSGSTQQIDVLSLYLEAIFVLVSSLSVAIRKQKDFIDVLWQYLCPTLIHLLGSPVSEVGMKNKTQGAYPEDGGRGGRSAGSPLKSKPLQSIARIIYNISKELIRLVGPMGTMRPVLESLFHRIILYPPPQQRVEALKAINDIFASPSHVVDIAGPVILDPSTPPTPDSPTEQKKSEVDLLKVLLDGIVECSHCSDLSVVGGSVACVVALLGSLEELGQGGGLSQEQVDVLKNVDDVDGWEKVEEKNSNKTTEDSPQIIPKFTLANEAFDEDEKIEVHHGKPKHIRWEMDDEPQVLAAQKQMQLSLEQMDLETVTQKFANTDRLWDISRTNPDGREQDVIEEGNNFSHPKSVHFATDLEEEFTIENRDDQKLGRFTNNQRHGIPRRVGLPRRIASSPARSGVVRRSASFEGKSKAKPVINDRRGVKAEHVQSKILRNDKQRLHRSNSDVGNSPTDDHEDEVSERRQIVSRSILRKSKPVSEITGETDSNEKAVKPKGILLNSHLNDFTNKKLGLVKINGILISRSRDTRTQVSPEKVMSGPGKVIEKRKSVEENEKEGARNFARCLLGILPSVLSLHDPAAVDEALLQFASDVCEAVTCMALKRKNVPNFGTLRGSSDLLDDTSGKGATSYLHYPILNADGVYAAVYATLQLNLKLHRAGYYNKKQEKELVTQEEFIKNTHDCGVDVGLSSVWLGELHRLVTTYDILEKAGYKADDVSSNRALIELLSDNNRTRRNSEDTTTDEAIFIHVQDEASMTMTQKQGVKFVRRILLLTWDALLDVLRVPIESPLVGAVQESIGIALMMASEGKKHLNKERDTVCLSLDGLRRIARLFCTLGIQTGCETVLLQLANASCGGEKIPSHIPKWKAAHVKNKMKLHAAHVLTMDALLAVGLELGSHAPKCWQHVFRCCSYIASLQNTQFLSDTPDSHLSNKVVEVPSPISEASSVSDFVSADMSSDGSASDIVRQHHESTPDTTRVLNPNDASRAIYALSTSVDRLFEHAANTLSSNAMVSMLESLAEASTVQLEKSSAGALTCDAQAVIHGNGAFSSNLHFCRMVDMLLRCTRDGKRPLLHLMKAWATVSKHFVKIMCENKQIFKFALDLIKDTLVVLLNNRNELPHFWFHETLFKPFENILASGKVNDAEQDKVLNTLCELARSNTGNIKSGWRSICSAARAIHMSSRPTLINVLEPETPIPKILEIITLFAENKTALVFSQAAVNCILCLSKCLHVQTAAEAGSDERSVHESETESNFSEGPYGDMCVPALELLSKVSQKLASIYVKPANVIFHGSHAVKLDNSSSPLSSPSSPIMSVADTIKDASTLAPNYARSITAMDDSGILRVWYLMLDVLTTTVITCPRKFQLQALDILFDVLHSVSSIPGPQFSILVLTNLLLPMLHIWLEKGTQTPEYWDRTAGNFKQACGLTTELIVGEMGQFLSEQGASECVLTLMRQVLDLLKLAVSQPDEVIARVGCSCFRHLLMAGGALFTEDIWKIICEGLRGAMRSTLAPIKHLIPCYQVGSSSVSGDDGYRVRVLTRRDASWEQTIRHGQLAEQVFLLESQLEEEFDRSEEEFPPSEDEDHRSFFFVISSSDNQENAENTTRVPLRGLVVGLLAHQLLLQSLGLLLLDNQDNSFAHTANPVNPEDESSMSGLLKYLSPANLSIIFDCLMESHTVAYEFNHRFGLRSLIQMIVRLCAPANLLRQSTMAFKFYLQTLLEICRYNGEHMSGSSVKRILLGDRSSCPDGESSLPEGINDHVTESKDAEWIVRRLNEACSQLSSVYNRLYSSYENEALERNLTSTPDSSPSKLPSHFGDDSSTSIRRKIDSPDILRSAAFCSRDRQHVHVIKKNDEMLQLRTWTAMTVDMLEALLYLPTLQFKPILPAIYPAVTSMIPVSGDPKVCRLLYDIVTRVGSIYGIV